MIIATTESGNVGGTSRAYGPTLDTRAEAMAMLWIDLAVNQKRGATLAFTLAGWSGATL